jgi:uncharacterized protein YcgI (DUF1989 family)
MMFETAILDRVVEPKAYLVVDLKQGQVLRVEDVEGTQCADLSFVSRASYDEQKRRFGDEPIPQSYLEQYSQGMTSNRNRHVYLGKGYSLYTNLCNRMLTIVEDTVGRHDVVSAWCNPELNYSRWGEVALGKRTCKENFVDAYRAYGIRIDLPFSFNIFMDYNVQPDGSVVYGETLSKAGDNIALRAEMDVLAAISNCPMELSVVNGDAPTRLRVSVFEWDDYKRLNQDAVDEPIEVDSMQFLRPEFQPR